MKSLSLNRTDEVVILKRWFSGVIHKKKLRSDHPVKPVFGASCSSGLSLELRCPVEFISKLVNASLGRGMRFEKVRRSNKKTESALHVTKSGPKRYWSIGHLFLESCLVAWSPLALSEVKS